MRILAQCCRLLFPLYETQQVWLTTQKVCMFKVPEFGVRVSTEDTLLEMGDLVKAVHVELADKGAKVLVFEPTPEDFTRESLLVEDWDGGQRREKYEVRRELGA